MSLTRRAFLKLLAVASLLKYSPRLFAAPSLRGFEPTLAAFLDTLMPADETPSASDLNVDRSLLQKAEGDGDYRRLLLNGCLWLENTAHREYQTGFAALEERHRVSIVTLMEQDDAPAIARAFFRRLQNDLFEHYYSRPESWQGLGIDQPPQPRGYPGYSVPPAANS